MACGSCGKRRKGQAALDPIPIKANSRLMFFAVGPGGEESPLGSLTQARAAARRGGAGWSIGSRRVVPGDS